MSNIELIIWAIWLISVIGVFLEYKANNYNEDLDLIYFYIFAPIVNTVILTIYIIVDITFIAKKNLINKN